MLQDVSANHPPTDNRRRLVAALAVQDEQPDGPALSRSSSMRDLAVRVLDRQWRALMAQEAGVREQDDIDAVHDMRVATRRLRAALRLYEDVLPARAQDVRQQLKTLADALGAVRDLDLQLEELRGWQAEAAPADRRAFDGLVTALYPHRVEARQRLLEVVAGPQCAELAEQVQRLRAEALTEARPMADQALGAVVPELVARQYKKLRKQARVAGRSLDPVELHQTRIRGKRVRYAVEFVAEVYGAPAQRFVRAMTALQDVLGEHQDAQVGIQRFKALVDGPAAHVSPLEAFLAGRLAGRLEGEAASLRQQFPDAYERVQQRWRSLHRAMARTT